MQFRNVLADEKTEKTMIKITRIEIITQLNKYLRKNKNRILEIQFEHPQVKSMAMCSDGTNVTRPISDEIITIKLKPKHEKSKKL